MAGFFGLCSLIPHSRPPLLMRLVGSFICTYLAPHRQPVFVDVCFVKVAFGLPSLAPSTSLLFHPVNNSMALLISIICFQALALFLVTLSYICPHAVFAPISKSVFVLTILAKLNLIFPLFAFGTSLHLHFSVYIFPFRILFLRPNLTILNLVAGTVLPIWSAICCAVLLGYNFLSRLSSFFDQIRFGSLIPNLCALTVTAWTDRPSWFAISCTLLCVYSFLRRVSSFLDQAGAVPTFLRPLRYAIAFTDSKGRPSLSAMLCVSSVG
jgi:hypothetical protein